jgi:hypothetical protein
VVAQARTSTPGAASRPGGGGPGVATKAGKSSITARPSSLADNAPRRVRNRAGSARSSQPVSQRTCAAASVA